MNVFISLEKLAALPVMLVQLPIAVLPAAVPSYMEDPLGPRTVLLPAQSVIAGVHSPANVQRLPPVIDFAKLQIPSMRCWFVQRSWPASKIE